MNDTVIFRRQLRAALEELADTINNLVNLLDSFDAASEDDFNITYASVVKVDGNAALDIDGTADYASTEVVKAR